MVASVPNVPRTASPCEPTVRIPPPTSSRLPLPLSLSGNHAEDDVNNGGTKKSTYAVLGALLGLCLVVGIATSSAPLGVMLVLGAGAFAGAILSGRLRLDRRYAAVAGAVGAASLFGTCAGVGERSRQAETRERERVVAVTRAREIADRAASVRSAAPPLLARVRTDIDRAHSLVAAGTFDEAHGIAEAAKAALAETAALVPPVDGATALLAEADAIFRDSANLSAIQAALLDARDAKATSPGADDALAWSGRLETLAAALRQAPPVAVERFGEDLSREADALDRLRARYRRQIERAQRREDERLARLVVCGDAPPLVGGFDGELVGSERFIARSAHDPDSVDVENCTVPVLTTDSCWVSVCEVRAKNLLGALVLARYQFSVGRSGILGARRVR